jgi:hypothetical protein
MIRQAQTYLVSAMSGATLIAVAIAVFVLLVSAQVFRDWPIAALGDSGTGAAAVSDGHAAQGAADTTTTAPSAAAAAGSATGARGGGSKAGPNNNRAATDLVSAQGATGAPAGGGGSESGGGDQSGTSAPASGGNASSPSGQPSSSGSGGNGGGSSATSSPSGKATETVNSTVNKVDETALGGTLDNAGVTKVTEGVVNGVVGPESPVGKVVDETVGAVGDLLPPNH